MATLKSILKPNQTVTIPFGSETVVVTYRPQYLTPEFEDSLKSLNKEESATEAFLGLFCGLIVSWDLRLEETDPEPIPITTEALRVVPYDILAEVLNRVQEIVVPNPQTGPTFDAGSLPADGSETSPIGTH